MRSLSMGVGDRTCFKLLHLSALHPATCDKPASLHCPVPFQPLLSRSPCVLPASQPSGPGTGTWTRPQGPPHHFAALLPRVGNRIPAALLAIVYYYPVLPSCVGRPSFPHRIASRLYNSHFTALPALI